ncbi:MAG: fimbrial biogenesis outer membrane usher protein [Sphingobium sp.]|nr:fimbrial biogenesis outer membrane usher protein [Sphingobium sp.]
MARPFLLHSILGGAAFLSVIPADAYADLPAPPRPAKTDHPMVMKLNLELVVNQAATGLVVPVEARGSHFFVDAQDLRSVHIQLEPNSSGQVDVTSLPGVIAHYDGSGQRLLLEVPADILPLQTIGMLSRQPRIVAESGTGALFNYNLYAARGGQPGDQFSLWNEVRLFAPFGVLRSTGNYLHSFEDFGQRRFLRYDTSFTYVDDLHIRTYEAGDFITRTLPRSGAVRMAGVQLSRNFSIRPDIITYPIPDFSGTATVPSAVDLFINGHHSMSGSLNPGPFTLNDFPYVNGAGSAVIVTSDAQGRRITTNIPFYVASSLLRQGLSDYALSAGFARKNYGSRAFSYGDVVLNAALRHGLTDWLTVESEGRYTPSFLLGGAGGLMQLGQLGVVEASATISRYQGTAGVQTRIGYQYSGRQLGLMMNHIRRSSDFADFAGVIHSGNRPLLPATNFSLPRRETQISSSVTLGNELGTISTTYIDISRKERRHRLASLSYSRPIGRNISLMMNASREFGNGRTAAMLQMVMPLGSSSSVISGVERNTGGEWRGRVGYSRATPLEGGYGGRIDLGRSRSEGTAYRADITMRTDAFQVQAGAYGQRGSHTQWAEVSGSVVMLGGQAFTSNRVNDAFILVSTDGFANVPVLQENRVIGATNQRGLLLLPHVSAYYGTKIGIDPLSLPTDMTSSVIEQRTALRMGGGKMVRFPVQRLVAATIIIHDRDGQPLLAGTPFRTSDGALSYVGWDGIAYLEQLSSDNYISATLQDGTECTARFTLPAGHSGTASIGPIACQ